LEAITFIINASLI